MAEIVNLRDYRKKRARQDKSRKAAANREKFGRTKGEVERDRREQERHDSDLESKRLEDDET